MAESRHFTLIDDWVLLNPEVTSTELRIYLIVKGNIKHGKGGTPESGFRATAAWIREVSGEMFSLSTVHKAMSSLAKKGVLRRLNNPQSGEGADFEFVVAPPKGYVGPRSVMAKAAEVDKRRTRSVSFATIPLPAALASEGEKSRKGDAPRKVDLPRIQADLPPQGGERTSLEVEFAAELKEITSRNTEPRMRLTDVSCERIAAAVRPALEAGWLPRALAIRMAAELNDRIKMPERFLIGKAPDFKEPPTSMAPSVKDPQQEAGFGGYVPPKNFHRGPSLERTPEEQQAIDERVRAYQEERRRADLLKGH